MFRIFALCCTLIVSGYAAADKESVALFKDYLPHQILEMPEEERSQSVPIMFIGAASLGTSKAGAVILQAQLNTLRYLLIHESHPAMSARYGMGWVRAAL